MKTDRKEIIKQLGEHYEKLLVVPAGSIDSDINKNRKDIFIMQVK